MLNFINFNISSGLSYLAVHYLSGSALLLDEENKDRSLIYSKYSDRQTWTNSADPGAVLLRSALFVIPSQYDGTSVW